MDSQISLTSHQMISNIPVILLEEWHGLFFHLIPAPSEDIEEISLENTNIWGSNIWNKFCQT